MKDVRPEWEQTGTPKRIGVTGILIALLIVACAAACMAAMSSRQEAARLRAELDTMAEQAVIQTEDFNIQGAKAYIEYLESQIVYTADGVTMKPDFDALRKQFNYQP